VQMVRDERAGAAADGTPVGIAVRCDAKSNGQRQESRA
jgi:hypothetical protein